MPHSDFISESLLITSIRPTDTPSWVGDGFPLDISRFRPRAFFSSYAASSCSLSSINSSLDNSLYAFIKVSLAT